jgi:hypothetical protein
MSMTKHVEWRGEMEERGCECGALQEWWRARTGIAI